MSTVRRQQMKGFRPSGRVVLLGAGATRGANFGIKTECIPPLNRDFFTQLQRITSKHDVLARTVVADVIELFGADFSLTLEDYFTQLEFLIASSEGFGSPSSGSSFADQLRQKRDRLMAAVSAVLEASTYEGISGKDSSGCGYHRSIVKHLRPGDTVLSFNYDCVIDDALRREGLRKWSAEWGYSFPPASKVVNANYWSPRIAAATPERTIYLLKLHGSVHWQFPVVAGSPVKLKVRLHRQHGTPRFDIVPPEWNKGIRDQPILRRLWQCAFRAVRSAEQIGIVGFSFTHTDLHVESLFRLALSENSKLKTLVIANPSSEDRRRIRRVFAPALARSRAIVRQYESLEEFTRHWPSSFDV